MADRMEETIAALGKFLEQLGPDDQVKLMSFNERVTSYTPFTNVHGLVASFAHAIRADGGTSLNDARSARGLSPADPQVSLRSPRIVPRTFNPTCGLPIGKPTTCGGVRCERPVPSSSSSSF